MATLVMITKLGLHQPLQMLSHDTHVNVTHSPALQSAIQTWSSPFKDKLPLFAPNSFKKHPGSKAPIKMYPKTGSTHRQARSGSQTESLGRRAVPMSAPGAMTPAPATSQPPQPCPAEPDPHPTSLGSATGRQPGLGLPQCPWLPAPGWGWDKPWLPFPAPGNAHGTGVAGGWPAARPRAACCCEPHTALPEHCINQHQTADLPPNAICAVVFDRGIPSWAHAGNASCPARGSQTQAATAADPWPVPSSVPQG